MKLFVSVAVMAEGADSTGGGNDTQQRTPDYNKLIDYGLNEKVAVKLDQIYQQGKLKHEVSYVHCLICFERTFVKCEFSISVERCISYFVSVIILSSISSTSN